MSHARRVVGAVFAVIVASCEGFVATGAMRAPVTTLPAAAQHASMSLVRKVRVRSQSLNLSLPPRTTLLT
jgi:hypothetical protein